MIWTHYLWQLRVRLLRPCFPPVLRWNRLALKREKDLHLISCWVCRWRFLFVIPFFFFLFIYCLNEWTGQLRHVGFSKFPLNSSMKGKEGGEDTLSDRIRRKHWPSKEQIRDMKRKNVNEKACSSGLRLRHVSAAKRTRDNFLLLFSKLAGAFTL